MAAVWGGRKTPGGDVAVKMERSSAQEGPEEGPTGLGTDWPDTASALRSHWALTEGKWVEAMHELVSKTFPETSTRFLSLSCLCSMLRGHVLRVTQTKGARISEWPCRVGLYLPSLLTRLACDTCKH